MGDINMSVEQEVAIKQPEKQPAMGFDKKLKDLFAGNRLALERVGRGIGAPDRFTDDWWNKLYAWLDEHDFHREKDSIAQITCESLDTLPPDAKLPRYTSSWISNLNGLKEKEPERKQIVDALRNSSIPLSLRKQLGKHLAEGTVTPYSVDPIMQAYGILGEDIGEEVRKQILPLFIAGLAYDKYELYKEDLVRLYKEAVAEKANTPVEARGPTKKQFFLSKIFKPKTRQESQTPDAESIDKKKLAERRVEVSRNLVLELFPPIPEDQDRQGTWDWWMSLRNYSGGGTSPRKSRETVSSDILTLPIETLEKYLAELRQLKELPKFKNLSGRCFSEEGIVSPYVALGMAFADLSSTEKIPPTSILNHLNGLDKSGNLADSTIDEVILGINKDLFSNDQIKPAGRRNLRILMEYQITQKTHTSNMGPLIDNSNIRDFAEFIEKNRMTREMALAFPQQAPSLMQDKMRETKIFIWEHGETMLKDTSDLKFLNRLVGEFGQKADSLIRGYQECLAASVITTDEKELVLEFAKQFRVVAPATLAGYKEAKQRGQEKAYIVQLKTLAEKMTGSGTITEEERDRPYCKDLLKHVYSNNAGQWSSFESNDSCADRNADLAGFKINPRYQIDLLSNSEIRIKAGESLNRSVQDEVQQPILAIAERMNALGHNKEKIMSALQENIDKTLEEILQKGGLQGIDLKTLTSTEEKMFLVLADSIYGTGLIDFKRVKDLVITYEFAAFEDISDYIAGTRDRVGRASNQDYALLCEVGAFYSDRIKEINRRLVTAAYNNPQITALMPEYFRQLSQDSATTQKQNRISRLQIDKLGASETFVKQLTKVLEKRKGRKYQPAEVREIIRRYEGLTGGLQEKTSTSRNPQTRAFYGQLRSQREKTFEALQIIAGEKVDPKTIHLGEISLEQAFETETGIKEGKYNGEQFASYTVQRFIDLFDNEKSKIERELAKFESMSGKQREILHGYITKIKESANARMVGGVCVAGDNPSKNKDRNMWNMPNYLQLVFQEPDTLQCQGLVLLHHFTQDGKRILTASLNPSSTYLYSVDETALFNGIMRTLEQFAQDNSFDMITVSQNRTIRTNRTGGQFEKNMDARITSVDRKFTFNSPQVFSYDPNYQLSEMDVVWEKT